MLNLTVPRQLISMPKTTDDRKLFHFKKRLTKTVKGKYNTQLQFEYNSPQRYQDYSVSQHFIGWLAWNHFWSVSSLVSHNIK